MDMYEKMQFLQSQPPQQQQPGMAQPQRRAPIQIPEHSEERRERNPIESGALEGMRAAKRSLEMDAAEKRRAMGMALMHVSHNLSKGGYGSGLGGMLAGINQSYLPATQTYQAEEARIREMNHKLMLEQREAERHALQDALERERFEHNRAYNQQYLNLLANRRATGPQIGETVIQTPKGPIDLSQYPRISSVAERNAYSKSYNSSNKMYKEVEHAKRDFEKLKELTKENTFAASGSVFGEIPNKVKNFGVRLGNALKPEHENVVALNKEAVLRERVRSKLEQLQPALERSLKGSAPGEQLLKKFSELQVYPAIGQDMNQIEDKLNELMKDLGERRDLDRLSLQTGSQIDALPTEIPEEGTDVPSIILEAKSAFPDMSEEEIIAWAKEKGLL